jgi:hypothetical protein
MAGPNNPPREEQELPEWLAEYNDAVTATANDCEALAALKDARQELEDKISAAADQLEKSSLIIENLGRIIGEKLTNGQRIKVVVDSEPTASALGLRLNGKDVTHYPAVFVADTLGVAGSALTFTDILSNEKLTIQPGTVFKIELTSNRLELTPAEQKQSLIQELMSKLARGKAIEQLTAKDQARAALMHQIYKNKPLEELKAGWIGPFPWDV